VPFDIAPSTQTGDRRAILRVDGATAPILQLANQCSFGVTPVQQYAHSYGESGAITVRANAGCSWTASAAAPWIHIDKSAGTGGAEIRFTVDQNQEPGRGTLIRKAPVEVRWNTPTLGENAWIWQFPNCSTAFGAVEFGSTPGVHDAGRNVVAFPPDGGEAHIAVLVESPFSCQWTGESLPAPPFVLLGGEKYLRLIFSGDGDLHVTDPPNTTGQQRTTSMVVGEATLTLTQPPK
jgi:hypothetical protein